MSIPNRIGAPTHVVPLTTKWHQSEVAFPANNEEPVPYNFYEGGDVTHELPNPTVNREADTKPQRVKPKDLNPLDFMKGGSSIL